MDMATPLEASATGWFGLSAEMETRRQTAEAILDEQTDPRALDGSGGGSTSLSTVPHSSLVRTSSQASVSARYSQVQSSPRHREPSPEGFESELGFAGGSSNGGWEVGWLPDRPPGWDGFAPLPAEGEEIFPAGMRARHPLPGIRRSESGPADVSNPRSAERQPSAETSFLRLPPMPSSCPTAAGIGVAETTSVAAAAVGAVAAAGSSHGAHQTALPESTGSRKLRVLIVDDVGSNLLLLRRAMERDVHIQIETGAATAPLTHRPPFGHH